MEKEHAWVKKQIARLAIKRNRQFFQHFLPVGGAAGFKLGKSTVRKFHFLSDFGLGQSAMDSPFFNVVARPWDARRLAFGFTSFCLAGHDSQPLV